MATPTAVAPDVRRELFDQMDLSGPAEPADGSTRRAVIWFVAAEVALVLGVLVALLLLSARAGTQEAVLDVTDRSTVIAASMPPLVLGADGSRLTPASEDQLRQLVAGERERAEMLRVKIWANDGTVVFSDERQLMGQRFDLGDEEVDALAANEPLAEVTDLSASENVFERAVGKALQVYVPVRSTGGDQLLFESYYPYSTVTAAAQRFRSTFLPLFLTALFFLVLLQVPLVLALLRRIRRAQQQRERSLQQAVESSMLERRRIAGDLHDGVVQELAGLSLTLAGTSQRLRTAATADPPATVDLATAEVVDGAAAEARAAIGALRSLLVEIYPPNLQEAGLAAALEGLAAGLRNRSIDTVLRVDPDLELDRSGQALVFRAAQEMVRNVQRHSRAQHAWVEVRDEGATAVLVVADDGVGVDGPVDREGHFGTQLLADLATEVGGRFHLGRRDGGGTEGRMEVPKR